MSLISKEHLNLAIQSLKSIFNKQIKDSTADWSQNDSSANNYVKNRTHYEIVKQNPIDGLEYIIPISSTHDPIPFEIGQEWEIYYESSYTGTWLQLGNETHPVVSADDGTLGISDADAANVPNAACWISQTELVYNSSWVNVIGVKKIKVVGVSGTYKTQTIHKLDEKYLPDSAINVQSDWNANETSLSYIKNKPKVATDDDVLNLLSEIGTVTPMSLSDGSIITNSSGEIYTL